MASCRYDRDINEVRHCIRKNEMRPRHVQECTAAGLAMRLCQMRSGGRGKASRPFQDTAREAEKDAEQCCVLIASEPGDARH